MKKGALSKTTTSFVSTQSAKRKRVIGVFLLVLIGIVLSSSFVFSAIDISSDNQSSFLYTSYTPGESINGWVNMSISDERTDLELIDSEENSITLLEWLERTLPSDGYSCVPSSCNPTYAPVGDGEDSITLDLDSGEIAYVGFKFDSPYDPITDIYNFNFTVSSDAGASCENQLEIQLLNDPEITLRNKASTIVRCPHLKNYGCFDSSKATKESYITRGKFCQKVFLYDSPGFYLGAWLKRETGAKETEIAIYDLSVVDKKAWCIIPETATLGETEYSCGVDVWNGFTPGNYYVCVRNPNEEIDDNTYVKYYNDNSTGCGFYTTGGIANEDKAYQIYAQGKEFDSFGTAEIGDDTHTDSSLNDKIKTYINDIYDGICNPCIVPVRFKAIQPQSVTITPILIQYDANGGYDINKVHNITMQGAKISTNGYKKLSLSNISFFLPSTFGTFKYSLDLGAENIFDEETLTIERAPVIKSIFPTETVHSFPVTITANVELANNASITSYVWKIPYWNFTRTTTTNRLEDYTFESGGTFDMELTVTDSNQKSSSKIFPIDVEAPGTYVTERVKIMKANLENISNEIAKMPSFEQIIIKNAINLSDLNARLQVIESLQVDLKSGSSPDYTEIVSRLTSLRIPSMVYVHQIATTLSFYPKKESVNLEVLESFHGGSHEATQTNEYIDAVVYSYAENMNGKISKKKINALYGADEETIAGVYELKFTAYGASLSGNYLIMKDMNGLTFKSDYGEERANGYVNIPLDGKTKTITFSTTENIEYFDLPLFVSPPLSELVIVGAIEEAVEPGIKWALFILILFFLLIFGLVMYVILQHWYKTKYETYLFRQRNFLFNLIHYINDSKKKGLSDKEIWKKLRQRGWTREQIAYVMRKYVGKRTGMVEIPVEKILNKIFGGKAKAAPGAVPQVSSKPGVVMPAAPGQPIGMPPRKPFSRRPRPSGMPGKPLK